LQQVIFRTEWIQCELNRIVHVPQRKTLAPECNL